MDPDRVEISNLARQAHYSSHIGRNKVDAIAALVGAINQNVRVDALPLDFTSLTDEDIDARFSDTTLFIFATDRFKAQARGNEVALRLGKPAIWIGLYPGGQAGEVYFWDTDIASCFRCTCASRYKAHEKAEAKGVSLDPSSDGADIFSIHHLDTIAGMIALGLITRGSDNRYGRLIDQLVSHRDGPRNFLQVKIDPTWHLRGRDIVREQLGISADNPSYFAWTTIARSDPDHGEPPCPDCVKYRGRVPKQQSE
jgi:hypothetical protein